MKRKVFTIVEITAVVVILGILALIGFISYRKVVRNSIIAQGVATARTALAHIKQYQYFEANVTADVTANLVTGVGATWNANGGCPGADWDKVGLGGSNNPNCTDRYFWYDFQHGDFDGPACSAKGAGGLDRARVVASGKAGTIMAGQCIAVYLGSDIPYYDPAL